MAKKIIVLNGSPKKDGNTSVIVKWFADAIGSAADIEIINTAFLKYKVNGCISCRKCQKIEKYECCIDDDGKTVLAKMGVADVIVFATPLYFFGASAQIKLVMDRMFSLYKWDNEAGTMQTPLKGRTMVVLASAFEDIGLEALEKPFKLTAEYTGMEFVSVLAANAGTSGEIIKKRPDIQAKVKSLAASLIN
ncbi:MAG: putative NAD(P)H-dependent FMN-containing oxidoreductase YwqN [Planctomycetes bacterium ADurb.Bin401]|nr:MAG: putative NAD(P)H-dependent FMN-containing oxidoreductase YwqN [Planctomycetes bacterium ADurb.Bin401]